MNVIHFHSKSRHMIMSLTEFIFQVNEPDFHNFVSFRIDVNYSFIQASMNTECLDIDFIEFCTYLKKMHEMEVKEISFIPTIEKNIVIKMNLTEFGHINVQIRLQNHIDRTILQFEYEIDQSFLPELIREIEDVLERKE